MTGDHESRDAYIARFETWLLQALDEGDRDGAVVSLVGQRGERASEAELRLALERAALYSRPRTVVLHGVDPQACLTDAPPRLADPTDASDIGDLLPDARASRQRSVVETEEAA